VIPAIGIAFQYEKFPVRLNFKQECLPT